jgi:hypothetical protein
MDWIDGISEIIRTAEDAERGWPRVIRLCKEEQPSDLWDALPSPDTKRDVRAAAQWLTSEISAPLAPKPVRGVYLGLDTLNMEGGAGHNVELGATASCDPLAQDGDWAWDCEWYGQRHLIRGLVDLKAEYEREPWKERYQFADYALFLGYSGLVLGDALAAASARDPLLAIWGFHEGDLFLLGRRTQAGVERLCSVL